MNEPRKGEIWWLDGSPDRGSEQIGRRPAVIVQIDAASANPRYRNVIVAAVSTSGKPVSSHISIHPTRSNGLTEQSTVKCEQLFTVSKDRLLKKVGCLSPVDLARVEEGLRLILGL